MVEKERKMTFRVTDAEYETYQMVAEDMGYESMSDMLRASLKMFVEAYSTAPNERSMVLTLPARAYERCRLLVDAGEYRDIQDVINTAVKAFLESEVEKIKYTRTSYQELARMEEEEMRARALHSDVTGRYMRR